MVFRDIFLKFKVYNFVQTIRSVVFAESAEPILQNYRQ